MRIRIRPFRKVLKNEFNFKTKEEIIKVFGTAIFQLSDRDPCNQELEQATNNSLLNFREEKVMLFPSLYESRKLNPTPHSVKY